MRWPSVLLLSSLLGACSSTAAPVLIADDAGLIDASGTPDVGEVDAGVCEGVRCPVRAGQVRTMLANSGAGDDLTLHPDGYLVASDPIGEGTYNAPAGHRLLRVDFDGTVSELAGGLRKPLGNTVGPDGRLYACEWSASGSVFEVDLGGTVREIAQGVAYASNVVALEDGSVLVTAYGTNEVLRIPAAGGAPASFAQLARPVGMDVDHEGAVIVAGAEDGRVHRLGPDGTPELIAVVDAPGSLRVADLVAAHGGLYATSFSGHSVWRITAEGRAEVFAGTGRRGGEDGPALQASFNSPNGIAASPDGRTLYVQELLGGLRVIPILDE